MTAAAAPLPPLTGFGDLLHPLNPVVFLDIATEAAHGKAKPPPEERGRVFIELFAHWSPLMAENFRQLCTGEARRGGGGAAGGGGDPVGYRGSFFYKSIAGRSVVGGDVMRGDGTGVPFSIHGGASSGAAAGGGGPFFADCLVPNETKRSALNHCPGLVLMEPSPIAAKSASSAGEGEEDSGCGGTSVGCSFSVTLVTPAELPQTWLDQHWGTVVGRVIARVDAPTTAVSGGAAAEESNGVAVSLRLLHRCSRDVYSAQREAGRASTTSGLPMVAQCGEM